MSVVVRQLINSSSDLQIFRSSGPAAVFVLPALLTMWQEVMGWNGLSISFGKAAIVGFEKSTAVGTIFFSMPFGGYGGIREQNFGGDSEEVIAGVLRRNYLQENIVQFDGAGEIAYPATYDRTALATHIVDLTAKLNFSDNTSRNIRKSAESGFALTKLDSSYASKYLALLNEHQQRTGETRRLPQKCYEYLLTATARADSGIEVYAATNSDGIQCIHIYFTTASDAFYFDGFSSQAGLDQGANFFLLDAMIGRTRERGIERLNLGATPPLDEGLRRFKEGWGAKSVAYVEYRRRSQIKHLLDFLTRLR